MHHAVNYIVQVVISDAHRDSKRGGGASQTRRDSKFDLRMERWSVVITIDEVFEELQINVNSSIYIYIYINYQLSTIDQARGELVSSHAKTGGLHSTHGRYRIESAFGLT
jgi:hypothetical protein